jgi:2-hydroxychromene-2-carboxylate isomerase
MEVEFFFGLGSRYSYLAFTQIARIEASHSCTFNLQPISSVELMHLRGTSPFQGPPLSGQYERNYRRSDAEAWAKPPTQDRRKLSRYMRRWLVERFFAWIQWQRRILVRWEYHAHNFLGFVQLACLVILFKRF